MIVIMGPAGAGKSTQGKLLAEELKRKALSVGQICREHFYEYTKTGAMVEYPELTRAIVAEVRAAEKDGKKCVLDAQPWDAEGAEIQKEAGMWESAEVVVVLKVSREEALRRLSSRGRDDDNPEVWNKKLDMFEQKICSYLTPVKSWGVPVVEVDGEGSVEEVSARVLKVVLPFIHDVVI